MEMNYWVSAPLNPTFTASYRNETEGRVMRGGVDRHQE